MFRASWGESSCCEHGFVKNETENVLTLSDADYNASNPKDAHSKIIDNRAPSKNIGGILSH